MFISVYRCVKMVRLVSVCGRVISGLYICVNNLDKSFVVYRVVF